MFCYYIKLLQLIVELLMFYVASGIESLQPYPSRLMRRGLIFLLLIFTILCGLSLSSATWGGAALHLSPPLGFCLGFLLVGELQLDQISFDPLPSLPRNPLMELLWESSPGHLVGGAQQACFAINLVFFTLHPFWRCCIARLRYANRLADQPVHPGCWLVWCLLTT